MRSTVTKDRRNRRLIVERRLPAPQAIVWASWTEPERVARWWGPSRWRVDIRTMDVRPGGRWHYRLHPAEPGDGEETWCLAVYRTVDPPVLLEYVDAFADASGSVVDGTEMPTTVTFTAAGDETLLAIVTTFGTVEQLDHADELGMASGFVEALERLAGTLSVETRSEADR
jgi:uncharacterized protein YndB with AHSA1/START domain